METSSNSIAKATCPHCNGDIVLGLGQYSPEVLYALKPEDLEKRKADFLQAVKDSTMNEDQKSNILKLYGDPKIMIDPQAMSVMHEEVMKKYSVTNLENK